MIETEVIQHKLQIAAVGFEIDVEHVAEDRHASSQRIEADIDQHLEKLVVRHPETPGLVDDDKADSGCSEITDAGDQAENGVGTEGDPCAGYAEGGIHQPGQAAYPPQTRQMLDRKGLLLHRVLWSQRAAVQSSCGSLLLAETLDRLFERRRGLAGYLSGGEQQMLAIGRALIAQPRLMLLDEPSLGLSPMLVENIFSIIARINHEQGVSMLLVEQNASVALAVANYGYIMETGKVVIDGSAEKLAADPDVREFYLGVGGTGEARGFRDIKHYKRRKRWLS